MLETIRAVVFVVFAVSLLSQASPITYATTEQGVHVVQNATVGSPQVSEITNQGIPNTTAINSTSTDNNFSDEQGSLLSNVSISFDFSDNSEIDCFRRPTKGSIGPTQLSHCFDAAGQIVSSGQEKSTTLLTWGDKNGVDLPLPQGWTGSTCKIVLNPEYGRSNVQDEFSRQALQLEADAITERCVGKGTKHLGGSAVIGPKKVLRLTVYGAASADIKDR